MAAPRDRSHLILQDPPATEPFSRSGGGSQKIPPPLAGRPAHGQQLTRSIEKAEADGYVRRTNRPFTVTSAISGLYIEVESQPGVALATASLQDLRKGIEVVNQTETISTTGETQSLVQKATVFVPDGQLAHFIKRLEAYSQLTPKRPGERRYEDTFDRIGALRLATVRALWTDEEGGFPPDEQVIWWELWLRRTDGGEVRRLRSFAESSQILLGERHMTFHDRIIILAHASAEQISTSIDILADLAELRRAKELATFIVNESPQAQAAWAQELAERLIAPSSDAPAVCVLDTGVTQGHPLLAPALDLADVHAADPRWGGHDDSRGHGTEMAGLALFGDLAQVIGSSGPVVLRHRIEAVKLIPPRGRNAPDLYGAITATAVSYPEVQAPARTRVFSMAITSSDQLARGKPSSWSASIDALSAGRSIDASSNELLYLDNNNFSRLFVIAAGNIDPPEKDHLTRSDLESIQDPAQAWNALTVGAFTDRAIITDPHRAGWEPLVKPGELTVWSSTSVSFAKIWPIKPDVVAEGGNVAVSQSGTLDFPIEELSLLTTYCRPDQKAFTLSWATSAACAQVARMCARIASQYPSFRPETIRGIVVHSAEWTNTMLGHIALVKNKRARLALVRRYGFGVPSESRATRSASNSLTLIAQSEICPFAEGKLREMHLYNLPWPTEILESLGDAQVRLRITLSYFIEPNPARRGRTARFRYASHGLRFAVKHSVETVEEFRKRINSRALTEDEGRPSKPDDNGWFLGESAQTSGSLHADMWHGTAADLAARGVVAVYPVSGWWKELKRQDRSNLGVRYALIVSIDTAAIDIDIWTPVAVKIGAPIAVPAVAHP
ncbi:S8 family peptidase [Nannocystis punicea]|uniref:S8 family peptidase n=1 Tax=Nannocystis punicea TaxID=2995304 RepID=A0ABY7H046_9BACT|nr:S8 family peptidase [Nannocystis poenicansa]WAS92626.1 S8 family peptidase [Nannocystis poenicansa]